MDDNKGVKAYGRWSAEPLTEGYCVSESECGKEAGSKTCTLLFNPQV